MTETPRPDPSAPPAPKKGLWARLQSHILHPELTPQQVALSFALGFHICWNPLLGLHTGMVLVLCFAFRRLHRPVMLLGAFLNNPWTMVPIATANAYAGNLLLGRGLNLDLSAIEWTSIGFRSFTSREGFEAMAGMLKPILLPYLLGGFALSLLALGVGYGVMLWLTLRLRAMHLHLPPIHVSHPHASAPDTDPK